MDALLNEISEMEIVPVEEEVKQETLPDDESLAARWKELAAETPQPRLANALANAKLSIREEEGNKILEFSVTNEAQKRWIEEKMLHDLVISVRIDSYVRNLLEAFACYKMKQSLLRTVSRNSVNRSVKVVVQPFSVLNYKICRILSDYERISAYYLSLIIFNYVAYALFNIA